MAVDGDGCNLGRPSLACLVVLGVISALLPGASRPVHLAGVVGAAGAGLDLGAAWLGAHPQPGHSALRGGGTRVVPNQARVPFNPTHRLRSEPGYDEGPALGGAWSWSGRTVSVC